MADTTTDTTTTGTTRDTPTATSARVPGHTLWYEGAPHDDNGRRRGWQGTHGQGRGVCSCGERSDVLTSGYQRKQWHREHKAAVLAAQADPGGT